MKINIICGLFLLLSSHIVMAEVPVVQREALVELFQSTSGENWIHKDNWLQGDPCDEAWYGVVCSNGEISALMLSENNLNGQIRNSISALVDLSELSLSSNSLYGQIPEGLTELTNLTRLSLQRNALSGVVPENIGNLSELRTLNLFSNQLIGTLPDSIGSLEFLSFFTLSGNAMSGDFPNSITQLSSLFVFVYDHNALRAPNSDVEEFLIGNSCFQDIGSLNFVCSSNLQTLAPSGFQVSGNNQQEYTFTWEVVDYNLAGGYLIWTADKPGADWRLLNQVDGKATSSWSSANFRASSEQVYRITSFTDPHDENSNYLISQSSDTSGTTGERVSHPMSAKHSGSWFNPDQNGHGLVVEVLSESKAIVYWYVFDDEGRAVWLIGVGTYDGQQIMADMFITKGGKFPPLFDSDSVERIYWGQVNVYFTADNEASVAWNTINNNDYLPGKLNMEQFTRMTTRSPDQNNNQSGLTNVLNPTHSGTWYNPEQDGHGLAVEILPDGVGVIYWYVYDFSGNQVWLLGNGSYTGSELNVDLNIVSGGLFPPEFNAEQVNIRPWGTASFKVNDCNKAEFNWSPNADQTPFSGGQLDLQRLTQLIDLNCEI